MPRGAMRPQYTACTFLVAALCLLAAFPEPAHSFSLPNLFGSSENTKSFEDTKSSMGTESSMDANLKRVLEKHNLRDAVAGLADIGVYDSERLRLLEDDDIDTMVNSNGLPLMTGRLLKSKRSHLITELDEERRTAEKIALEAADANGETALMRASRDGNSEVVGQLLAKGADVQAREKKHGLTALIYATHEGHSEVVGQLLAKGADVQAQDKNGKTALMLARPLGPGHSVVKQLQSVQRASETSATEKAGKVEEAKKAEEQESCGAEAQGGGRQAQGGAEA